MLMSTGLFLCTGHISNWRGVFAILHSCVQTQCSRAFRWVLFMFCWPCVSIYTCNGANLMHCLSAVYSVTTPLHVSGLLVAHHQEVTMCICDSWYVLYWKEDCLKLLEYLHVVIKCEACSCDLNVLKGIGKLSTFLCLCRAVPWPWEVAFRTAWSCHGTGAAWHVWIKHGRTV
jgi:hypothetical protein